jgi:hypothetical protein
MTSTQVPPGARVMRLDFALPQIAIVEPGKFAVAKLR